MKSLLTLTLLSLTISISACTEETVIEPAHTEPVKQISVTEVVLLEPAKPLDPAERYIDPKEPVQEPVKPPGTKSEPVTKLVCITVYNSQQKRDVEKCRTMQLFEKEEGTPIPK